MGTTAEALRVSDGNEGIEKQPWDCIVLGGGHNGLTAASYMAKAGKKTLVLERRPVLGGAAVTEEVVPGFSFSRASYVYSLMRPDIVADLELAKHGLRVFPRIPGSFSPCWADRIGGKRAGLVLGGPMAATLESISQFSTKDAAVFEKYCEAMERAADSVAELMDVDPPDPGMILSSKVSWEEKVSNLVDALKMAKALRGMRDDANALWEIMTAPASKLLDRWFESDVLKATLAMDAVIGAMVSPHSPGSAYVLLHHVMGELEGERGLWGYAQGGMGAVSAALANAAREHGVTICASTPVDHLVLNAEADAVRGVKLSDGRVLDAKTVIATAGPQEVLGPMLLGSGCKDPLPAPVRDAIRTVDATPSATKINLALSDLPHFPVLDSIPAHHYPPPPPGASEAAATAHPALRGTIHFEETIEEIDQAFKDAYAGKPSTRPAVELCLPSILDPTIAPPGKHVATLFVQYTPWHIDRLPPPTNPTPNLRRPTYDAPPLVSMPPPDPSNGWLDDDTRANFLDRVFGEIEEHAPGFRDLVIDGEMLTPPDLQGVFGLPKGNIFHTAMSVDQLFWSRPTAASARYAVPGVEGLFLGGAGAHPGGGVLGAPGRNAARKALQK